MNLLVIGKSSPHVEAALAQLESAGHTLCRRPEPPVAAELPDLAATTDLLLLAAMDAFDTLQCIRHDVVAATLPIAVWAEGAEGRRALEAGADLWLASSDLPEDHAARLIALLRRAQLGGGPRLDAETGLLGRARTRERLRHEFDRAARYRRALALLVIAPDPPANLLRGGAAEISIDPVLRSLAQTLRPLVRDVDLLGRLGAEQCAMLLPETDAAGALVAARRAHAAFTARRQDAGRAGRRAAAPEVTVSIGLAAIPARGIESADDLLGRALEAVGQARHRGGNQVLPFGASDIVWSRHAPRPDAL